MGVIADDARARGVLRLVHVTPAARLPFILRRGLLLPDAPRTSVGVTRGGLCCAVQWPPVAYLVARQILDPVALLLDVDLLDRPDARFWATNSVMRGMCGGAGLDAWQDLFAPSSAMWPLRPRRPRLLPSSVPSQPDAEVVFSDPVHIAHVFMAVVAADAGRAAIPRGLWPVSRDPRWFTYDLLAGLRVGRAPRHPSRRAE